MHGLENQDSHAKMGVNGQCMQPLCLPAWEGDNCTYTHVWVLCQWCVHAIDVVNLEALWRLTGIHWNWCVKQHLRAMCGGMWIVPVYPAIRKLPACKSTSYRYAIVWTSVFGDMYMASQCCLNRWYSSSEWHSRLVIWLSHEAAIDHVRDLQCK